MVVALALERPGRAVLHAGVEAEFERCPLGFHARALSLESLVGEGEFAALSGLFHRDVEADVDGRCLGLLTWG